MPKVFEWLQWLEFLVVCTIGLGVLALAVYSAFWIVFACEGTMHSRLVRVINGVNNNWRFDLLVIVVLFFRPIFKFLWNLREGPFGMKRGGLKPTEGEAGSYESK